MSKYVLKPALNMTCCWLGWKEKACIANTADLFCCLLSGITDEGDCLILAYVPVHLKPLPLPRKAAISLFIPLCRYSTSDFKANTSTMPFPPKVSIRYRIFQRGRKAVGVLQMDQQGERNYAGNQHPCNSVVAGYFAKWWWCEIIIFFLFLSWMHSSIGSC